MDRQQAFDRKRTKQQRWNRQDNYSSQPRSRDSSRREEGPPHRPGPSRKRDDRSRVRGSNTRQSNGPCQVSTEGAVRLPYRPDYVRCQNSTLTASPVSSLEQFRRESTQDGNSKISPHGRSTQQRTSRRHIQTKEPGVRTLQSTHERTVQSRTSSRSLDQPTPTSPHSRIFFTLFSESRPLRTRGKPILDYVRFMTLA